MVKRAKYAVINSRGRVIGWPLSLNQVQRLMKEIPKIVDFKIVYSEPSIFDGLIEY